MRIGIDARLWAETGVGRYIRNIVKNLSVIDKKNQYTLFVLQKDFNDISLPDINWNKVIADIRWHTLEEQIQMPKILNREILDLVHFPYFSVPIFYNKPYVVTIHDLILDHFPTGEASTLLYPIYKIKYLGYTFVIEEAVRKAKKILTVSNATKDELVSHLHVSEEKIKVVYNGIDPLLKNAISKEKISQPYFLYVGNAYPHKNLISLVNSFALFNKEYPLIQLILVGKEDFFYKKLKSYILKHNLEDKVILFGQATDNQLYSLYKQAIALVAPSLMEGFNLPVVEAMSYGCPVIASDTPVHKEIIGDVGFYVNPNSEKDIAELMKNVYCITQSKNKSDKKALEQKIKNGYAKAKTYSWEKAAKEILSVYTSCARI